MSNPFGSGGGGFTSAQPSGPSTMPVKSPIQQAQDDWAKKQAGIAGMITPPQSQFESDAGVNPSGYQGVTDESGKLLDQYSVDPFKGEASQRLRSNALSNGPTEWGQAALGKQKLEQNLAMGKVGREQQMAQSEAQSGLARLGGLGSGARTSLARSGARDRLAASQGVGAQGALARYGINADDAKTKQALLGGTADVERSGQAKNLETVLGSLGGQNAYNANRYNQQMGAWGANKTAEATRLAAANSGRSGGLFK